MTAPHPGRTRQPRARCVRWVGRKWALTVTDGSIGERADLQQNRPGMLAAIIPKLMV